MLPSESVLPVPSKSTRSPSFTFWSGPALAVGGSLGCFTTTFTSMLARAPHSSCTVTSNWYRPGSRSAVVEIFPVSELIVNLLPPPFSS